MGVNRGAANTLRQHYRIGKCAWISMSDKTERQLLTHAFDLAGHTGWLLKPPDQRLFRTRVERFMAPRR